VLGLVTNIPFLLRVLDSEAFRRGELHTGFLDDEGSDLCASPALPAAALAAAVVHDERAAMSNGSLAPSARPDPWTTIDGWRV
jgi:acetyl/propionyl-CoA carboxylase alpha subunit